MISPTRHIRYHSPTYVDPGDDTDWVHINGDEEEECWVDDDLKKKLREDDCGLSTILQPSEMTANEAALHEAAKSNDVEKVKKVLDQRPDRVDVNCRNNFDRTALHWAAAMGHCEVIETLVNAGADIDARDKYGMWPILWTAWFGHLEALKAFIKLGAKQLVSNKQGMDVVHCASQNNHVAIIHYLFESLEGINRNNVEKNQRTSLHLAAEAGNTEAVDALTARKVDISLRDKTGNTALHLAAKEGRSEVVEHLISCEAFTRDRNDDGKTALHLAAENGHLGTVKPFLEDSADVNAETVKEMTPVHLAAMNGHTAVVADLIEAGCDLNCKNFQGNTPLHLSAIYKHPEVTAKLVEADCKLDFTNQRCQTALQISVESGFEDIVETLLQARADIHTKDKHGRTAMHMAARGSFISIVDMIIQAERSRLMEELLAKELGLEDPLDLANTGMYTSTSIRYASHPNSEQMKGVLWKLAVKHLKQNDWKKLAMYWGFTQEHIKTIEHEYSGRISYKHHGFRAMIIWLVGLKKDDNPIKILYEALVAIGKRRLAEQIRREVNMQAEKPDGAKICVVS